MPGVWELAEDGLCPQYGNFGVLRDVRGRPDRLLQFVLLRTDRKHGCPVGNLAVELSDHSPEARAIAGRCFDRLAQAMADSLAAAATRFPRSADFADLAKLVLTTIEGGIVLARAQDDLAPFDASVRQLRNYFRLLQQEARSPTSLASNASR